MTLRAKVKRGKGDCPGNEGSGSCVPATLCRGTQKFRVPAGQAKLSEAHTTGKDGREPTPSGFTVKVRRAVVLLSGGLDSTTLLWHVARRLRVPEIHALSFRYGQKHVRELRAARWQARRAGVAVHRVIDIAAFGPLVAGGGVALIDRKVPVPALAQIRSGRKDQPPTYVPNRNMIMLALAAAYAEAHGIRDIFYGAQSQDNYGYWDCTPAFVARLNAALALNRREAVRVHAPFIRMRKADELRLGLALGVDFGKTWTCYRGGPRPCGECPSCVERALAFREAGVVDPILGGG